MFMEYNKDYINIKYTFINCFLIKMNSNILDISYSVAETQITIQIVLIEGSVTPRERIDSLRKALGGFSIVVTELYLTKEQFNESKGEWQPQYYKWLDYLLFSKAEIL